ncbi:hypothetical protein OS493_007031 [Desmophyllum pertusum]|uniref:Uncharacterized protein n=1 Tax=Desmophyllum pertusum TaxID=174260 RepID=A0A9W9ZG20_9CNID|nr:hypothetical protein OS493_007031 [Desmophyllum pertusum]
MEGLQLYGLAKIILSKPEVCKALFVKPDGAQDQVNANYVFSLVQPMYSAPGSSRKQLRKISWIISRTFFIGLEDEENITGYASPITWNYHQHESDQVLNQPKEEFETSELTPSGIMGLLTGQKHQLLNGEELVLTASFDHDCFAHNPNHKIKCNFGGTGYTLHKKGGHFSFFCSQAFNELQADVHRAEERISQKKQKIDELTDEGVGEVKNKRPTLKLPDTTSELDLRLISKIKYTSIRNSTDVVKESGKKVKNNKTEIMKKCEVPKIVPYKSLTSFIRSIDIGEIIDLETLADLFLFQKVPCLHWFNGGKGVMYIAIGADGAPFGRDDTATAYRVSILNLLQRVQSCNDNHLLMGSNSIDEALHSSFERRNGRNRRKAVNYSTRPSDHI